MNEAGQRESVGRRRLLAIATAGLCAASSQAAAAPDQLDPGPAKFGDYGNADNGSSFFRIEGLKSGNDPAELSVAKLLGVDNQAGSARVRFESVKLELAVPLGWEAGEDWERGVAASRDKRYRLFVWRVDFAFEGVRDAEHYAATKSGSIQARRPTVKAQARKLGDGSFLVVYENVPPGRGDSEPRIVFDLLLTKGAGAKRGVLVTLGVPAAEAERGLRLMALIKPTIKADW
jgi:hypothetical protein